MDLNSTYNNIISSDTTTLGGTTVLRTSNVLQWEPRTDRIHYARCRGDAKDDENTMRSVASLLARPFDPIGLVPLHIASSVDYERISLAWYEVVRYSSTRTATVVEEMGGTIAVSGKRALLQVCPTLGWIPYCDL